MTQERLEYFKIKLIEKKSRLLEELGYFAKENPVTHTFETHYSDMGDDSEDNEQERVIYERDIQVEATLEESIQKIDRALMRIEQGTYGKDINTGVDIDEKRLEVLPEAETIV